MKTIKVPFPTNAADAIRVVCYLRAWTAARLATEMGLADGSNLSKILKHKEPGTAAMLARILEHMPEKAKEATK